MCKFIFFKRRLETMTPLQREIAQIHFKQLLAKFEEQKKYNQELYFNRLITKGQLTQYNKKSFQYLKNTLKTQIKLISL